MVIIVVEITFTREWSRNVKKNEKQSLKERHSRDFFLSFHLWGEPIAIVVTSAVVVIAVVACPESSHFALYLANPGSPAKIKLLVPKSTFPQDRSKMTKI